MRRYVTNEYNQEYHSEVPRKRMMVGKKMIAIARRNYEFSSIEKWKNGEKYNMVYDELGGVIELESDGGYVGHWSTAAFKIIRDNFEIKL